MLNVREASLEFFGQPRNELIDYLLGIGDLLLPLETELEPHASRLLVIGGLVSFFLQTTNAKQFL